MRMGLRQRPKAIHSHLKRSRGDVEVKQLMSEVYAIASRRRRRLSRFPRSPDESQEPAQSPEEMLQVAVRGPRPTLVAFLSGYQLAGGSRALAVYAAGQRNISCLRHKGGASFRLCYAASPVTQHKPASHPKLVGAGSQLSPQKRSRWKELRTCQQAVCYHVNHVQESKGVDICRQSLAKSRTGLSRKGGVL